MNGETEVRRFRQTFEAYRDLYPCEVARNNPLDFDRAEEYRITSYRDGEVWNRNFGHLVKVEEVVEPVDHSADPRLAELPEDLRAIACEFLSLHGAWETEFEARFGGTCVQLSWSGDGAGASATLWGDGTWSLAAARREEGQADSFRRDQPAHLRARSADFAEFVQRFREGGE